VREDAGVEIDDAAALRSAAAVDGAVGAGD
jgi:hypothetical protein